MPRIQRTEFQNDEATILVVSLVPRNILHHVIGTETWGKRHCYATDLEEGNTECTVEVHTLYAGQSKIALSSKFCLAFCSNFEGV